MQVFNTISHPILNKYIQPIHKNKIIYFDENLTDLDKVLIIESALHWKKQTGGLVNFNFKISTTQNLLFADNNETIVITSISSNNKKVKLLDLEENASVLAFFTKGYSLPTIVLIPDRTEDEDTYRAVIIHEIGHSLGLKHSFDKNSIMYPTTGVESPLFLTSADMQHFCLTYYCNPNKLQ